MKRRRRIAKHVIGIRGCPYQSHINRVLESLRDVGCESLAKTHYRNWGGAKLRMGGCKDEGWRWGEVGEKASRKHQGRKGRNWTWVRGKGCGLVYPICR
jgi:hypothetical protein